MIKQKTFRLFVSSTFADFVTERNLLNDVLYPELSEFCEKRGYSFQLIDLRWGVYSEASLNQKTIPICLKEIECCQTLSPRPCFLTMLGERYGWVPLPYRIAKQEMEKILSVLKEDEKVLIEKWYFLDQNDENEVFLLKERAGQFVEKEVWRKEENVIRSVLQQAAVRAEFDAETLQKYFASATEQEIVKGLFSLPKSCSDSFVVFRDNYISKDEDLKKVNTLREKIKDHLKKNHCEDNLIELDYSDQYQSQFVEKVGGFLKKTISEEMDRIEEEKQIQTKRERLAAYCREDMPYIDPNYAYVKLLYNVSFDPDYSYDQRGKTVFMNGCSGCGKTSLLARFLYDFEEANISFVFYGENEYAFSILSALRYLIQDISEQYGLSMDEALTPFNYAELFAKVIWMIPREKNHVIVIDGLDGYEDIESLKQNFLPYMLPDNVRIIVSSADPKLSERFAHKDVINIDVEPLNASKSEECFNQYLQCANRRIVSEEQQSAIRSVLNKKDIPLYGKMLAAIAGRWRSTDKVSSLPKNGEDAADDYIRSVFQHGDHDKDFVLYSLALIAVAPIGLTEMELLEILFSISSVRDKFMTESRQKYEINHLPFAFWSGVLFDLKDVLDYSYYKGALLIRFSHALFDKVMTTKYASYCKVASEKLMEYCRANMGSKDRLSRMLLTLLERNEEYEQLVAYTTDPLFVDSYIRQNDLAHIMQLMLQIQPHLTEPNLSRNNALLDCIVKHQAALESFPDTFLTYACETGLCVTPAPLCSVKREDVLSGIVFPYGFGAKSVWKTDGSMFVAYTDQTLHVVSADGTEIAALSLKAQFGEPKDGSDGYTISRVLWAGDYVVLVFEDDLYVYGLDASILDLRFSTVVRDAQTVAVIESEGLLIFQNRSSEIEARYFDSWDEAYSVSLLQNEVFFSPIFCVSSEEKRIVLYNRRAGYIIYDALSGHFLKSVQKKRYTGGEPGYEQLLYMVVNDQLLHLKNKEDESNLLFDLEKNKDLYINPPQVYWIKQYLVGFRRMLILYPTGILSVDLDSFKTRYFSMGSIESLSWKIKDEVVSALTKDSRLITLNPDEFEEVEPICVTKHNLFFNLPKKKPINLAKEFFSHFNIRINEPALSYDKMYEQKKRKEQIDAARIKPTLIVRADNGQKAIAYEYEGCILLTDEEGLPIYVIDRLDLGKNNNLLQLEFSRDARYLILRTDLFVQVFCVPQGKCVLRARLPMVAVDEVRIDKSEVLHLGFAGGERVEFPLSSGRVNRKISVSNQRNIQKGNCIDPNERYVTDFVDNIESFGFHPPFFLKAIKIGIARKRVYVGKKHYLLFSDGQFYLDGRIERPFENHESYDFEMHRQKGLFKENTPLSAYLSKKNDLFSRLYEYEREGILLLVSRMLNAVVLFDMNKHTIETVRCIDGEIIGQYLSSDGKRLTLFVDSEEKEEIFDINIPIHED